MTQKTAWFMDHRIRYALTTGSIDKLTGEVEADETFIGGKARNMHIAQRKRRITGTGGKDKTAVMGILQRGGRFAPSWFRTARRKPCKPKSASMSKRARRSLPTPCSPTKDWKATTPTSYRSCGEVR